jgi:hypothetical protein
LFPNESLLSLSTGFIDTLDPTAEAEGSLNLVIAILQHSADAVKTFIKALVDEDADRFNIKQKT